MRASELIMYIKDGGCDSALVELYGSLKAARVRLLNLAMSFACRFGDMEGVAVFSAPARTELIGNHTDHNGGVAVGAAIDKDILAVAAPAEGEVRIYEGDSLTEASLSESAEKGSSAALAAGMARRFGGGFVAVTDSLIPYGKGLSSSAAFSLLCGKIADSFYGGGSATAMELALAARETENADFGKACGLLDQICCAYGGTVHIDFSGELPTVTPQSFSAEGFYMYLVDTGVHHKGLEAEYGSIAEDMRTAAGYFGKDVLGQVDPAVFAEKKEYLRLKLGDRVYRRALHFFDENKRVAFFCRRAAMGQTANCLYAVNSSGISSRTNLRNVHKEADEATAALKDIVTAARIHGGGFGGALQCYVRAEKRGELVAAMEKMFGNGSVMPVRIREKGVCRLEYGEKA